MVRAFVTTSLVIATLYCSAQVVEEPKPKILHIQDVSVFSGFGLSRTATLQFSDFQKLFPGSQLLQQDMAGYQNYYYSYLETTGNFGVLVGMQFRDKAGKAYRRNPTLRAGFQYGSGVYFSGGKVLTTNTIIDTLISQQTGQMYLVDSINTKSYTASYTSQQIRLDVSLLFGTNSEARWSFYGGIGLNAGMSLRATTEITYGEFAATRMYFGSGFNGFNNVNQEQLEYNTEQIINKANMVFTGYVPLGIDFRVGKKRQFWKQVHLLYEIRPALTMTRIPELGVYPEAQIVQQFGIKVRW